MPPTRTGAASRSRGSVAPRRSRSGRCQGVGSADTKQAAAQARADAERLAALAGAERATRQQLSLTVHSTAACSSRQPSLCSEGDKGKNQPITVMPAPCVRFDTTVATSGNNTGIVVPPELVAQLGAGARPPVLVAVNGYAYRTTVGLMKGTHMVGISAAVRAATGVRGGDQVDVTLTLATTPREVDVPADLAAAPSAAPGTADFFATLSNSVQRFHIDTVDGAKTPETRQRRIDKAVSLFRDGKPR